MYAKKISYTYFILNKCIEIMNVKTVKVLIELQFILYYKVSGAPKIFLKNVASVKNVFICSY